MSKLPAFEHISPNSSSPTTLHPNLNPEIRDHDPPDPIREETVSLKDSAFFADSEKKALFSMAKATESIGTLLKGVQLSELTEEQLGQLVLLVNERGVVFSRNQDLTTEEQVMLFEHHDEVDPTLYTHGAADLTVATVRCSRQTSSTKGMQSRNYLPIFLGLINPRTNL